MRVLRVGDPHIIADSLEDGQALLDLILESACTHKVNRIEFLGDQFHTHAWINVHVLDFWKKNFDRLKSSGFDVLCLVGNHDMPGDGSTAEVNAMLAFSNVIVIDKPTVVKDCNTVYIPYTVSEKDFKKAALDGFDSGNNPTLVCHQSFFGSTYENGFPCLDGFKTDNILQPLIISGHIHRPQKIQYDNNSVWYLGSPRWRSISDANTERAIWVMEYKHGYVVDSIPIDTSNVCKQIFHFEDRLDVPLLLKPTSNAEYVIDIYGPQSFINERKKLWSFARVRTFNTEEKTVKVKESEGIEIAWNKYLQEFKAPLGTPTELLTKVANDRIKL